MPLARYIAWVGTSLLALLFVANWFLPQSFAEPNTTDEASRPAIRITSIEQPPERIVIDTSPPTIVPPPAFVSEEMPDEPPQPMPSHMSINPHTTAMSAETKKSKIKKKQVKEVAAKQHPLAPTTVEASSGPAMSKPPTRLSFANLISGQLVRELFNLH